MCPTGKRTIVNPGRLFFSQRCCLHFRLCLGTREWLVDAFFCFFPVPTFCGNLHKAEYTLRISWSFKALLSHYATCLAILLRHKLQAKLQVVTRLAIIKSRKICVARSIAQSRINTLRKDCRNTAKIF